MVSKKERVSMEKQLDLRVQKTRKALTGALYDLLCEKSLSEITVTELCDRAVIRKATFYKHFGDKTELLAYMIQELQRISLEENKIGYDDKIPDSYYIGVFRYFIEFLDSNEKFIKRVLSSNASAVAETIMSEQIEIDIREHLKKENVENFAQYSPMLAALYTGAVVNCGKWWITRKERPDKEQIIGEFANIVSKIAK
jgi:AcrR family transcriptional regulator